jgi:hypothetical protein
LPSASAEMRCKAVRSVESRLPRAACAAQEAPRRARGRPCAPMYCVSHAVCAAQRNGALACSSCTVARLLCPHTPQRRHSAAHVTATHAANASARLRGARRTAASAAAAEARTARLARQSAFARLLAATCARAETAQRARRRDVGPEYSRPHLLRQARGCAAVRASAPRRLGWRGSSLALVRSEEAAGWSARCVCKTLPRQQTRRTCALLAPLSC